MKTISLSTFILMLFSYAVHAQCTSTLTGPYLEFSPASGSYLPDAVVSQPYDASIEIFVPARASINNDSVDVLYYQFYGVLGAPANTTYTTSTGFDTLSPGSSCILLSNSSIPDSVGTDTLNIAFRRFGINDQGDTINTFLGERIATHYLDVVYGTPIAEAAVNAPTSICEGDLLVFSPLNSYAHASYTWTAPGATRVGLPTPTDTFTFPTAGVFNVILTASDVGTAYDTVTVNVSGYPSTSISPMGFTASCGGSAVLAYNPSGTFKVDAPQSSYNYQWYVDGSPVSGATDTIFSPAVTSGVVAVGASNNGCEAPSNGYTLTNTVLFDIELCVVTVDSATGKNQLVWERPAGASCMDSVKIWKETNVTDVYDLIATVDYNDLSTYIDMSSDPDQNADKYKLSLYDAGLESALSDAHKTIHLTVNVGQGNVRNLIWNSYEGAPVATYNIYRGTNPTNLTLYASVSGSNTSFTDVSPMGAANIYQIELVLPYACNPSKMGQAYTRSNKFDDSEIVSSVDDKELLAQVSIAPNPANGSVTIKVGELDVTSVKLFSLQGREVLDAGQLTANGTKLIDLSSLNSGLYIVNIELTNGSVLSKKLLIH